MTKLIYKILSLGALVAFNSTANASLIFNGSFEQTELDNISFQQGLVNNTSMQSFNVNSSAWDVFNSLPGWETTYGAGIELQKNVVTTSQSGNNHVELDSHSNGSSNSVMTQTLNSLTIGAEYLLEFYYKARTNNQNDNGINVFWHESNELYNNNMQASYVADGIKSETPDWVLKSVVFTAESESMSLSFGAFGTQNTLGGLLDNVSLTEVEVSEPSVLSALFICSGLLVMRRRKQKV